MEAFISYFMQSALILGGFLAVYHLFLKRDTLFMENRWFLLSGLVLSLIFPLIKIEKVVVAAKPILVSTEANTTVAGIDHVGTSFGPENVFWWLYLSVCGLMMVRFFLRLAALKKLKETAKTWKEHPYMHVETEKRISPFSFFHYIYYNPNLFAPNELDTILAHEKVHARQYHSVDILLLEFLKIVFWFNPILWLYKPAIKQNLEFLADQHAIAGEKNKKSYQYLMLRQVTENQNFRFTNSFYNSLIKKRIVMLNQNQSKRTNVLKTLFVLPLLGLFLVSFSMEEVYRYTDPETVESILDDKSVELTIDKDTSNDELEKMKKDLSKDGIDFSYTTVRNDNKEIIEITLNLSGKNSKGEKFSGNYSSNSDGPINELIIFYDDEANLVSFGNSRHHKVRIHKMDGKMTWNASGEKEITVKKVDGKKKIIINGKEIDEDELHSMDIKLDNEDGEETVFIVKRNGTDKNVKIKKLGSEKDMLQVMKIIDSEEEEVDIRESTNVMLIKDSDDDEDIEVIGGDSSFLFIDNDSGGEPLYYIDGKKASARDVKELSPANIESITVLKGKEALKEYGKKAKDGVVKIFTKKDEQ